MNDQAHHPRHDVKLVVKFYAISITKILQIYRWGILIWGTPYMPGRRAKRYVSLPVSVYLKQHISIVMRRHVQ